MAEDTLGGRFEDFLDSGDHPGEEASEDLDRTLRNLDRLLFRQINAILHHREFRRLEKVWRELYFLAHAVTDHSSHVALDILPVSKEALVKDLTETQGPGPAGLYQHLRRTHWRSDSGPYSAVVLEWEIGRDIADAALLSRLADLGAAAHTLFLLGVSADFFGVTSYPSLEKIPDISSHLSRSEYVKWKSVRESDHSRFLVFCAVGCALRLPYDAGESNTGIAGFREESWRGGGAPTVWGNPAFGMASSLLRAFENQGDLLQVHGRDKGLIGLGPVKKEEPAASPGKGLSWLEAEISNEKALDLALNGINALCLSGESEGLPCFLSAVTAIRSRTYASRELTILMLAFSRLSWVFFECRIAHVVNALWSDFEGGGTEDFQRKLADWCQQQTVTDTEPDRPFRRASVDVGHEEEAKGWWLTHLEVLPARNWEEIDSSLHIDIWLREAGAKG